MSRGNWESHKLLFGEDTRLKPCPFCGAEPYVDSCDRIINIGCDKCGYSRHFHGLVQNEIETDVIVSRYKDSGKAYEWYDNDAYQKAAAGWNERSNRLDEICENYGLTPYGVEFALEQYQKVICEITHGMLSKLIYKADHVLGVAQERWCNTCELKEAQEQEINRLKHHVDCDAAEKLPSGCVGYGRGLNDDEPCETCKVCEKYNGYGEEERQ